MFTLGDVEAALPIVRAAVPPTPQYAWPLLCARVGAEVFVKHENHTPIGAFKLRGGLFYVERLKRERPHIKGIVSATRGNHGQSLAFAAQRAGLAAAIVVPHGNSTEKNAAMRGPRKFPSRAQSAHKRCRGSAPNSSNTAATSTKRAPSER